MNNIMKNVFLITSSFFYFNLIQISSATIIESMCFNGDTLPENLEDLDIPSKLEEIQNHLYKFLEIDLKDGQIHCTPSKMSHNYSHFKSAQDKIVQLAQTLNPTFYFSDINRLNSEIEHLIKIANRQSMKNIIDGYASVIDTFHVTYVQLTIKGYEIINSQYNIKFVSATTVILNKLLFAWFMELKGCGDIKQYQSLGLENLINNKKKVLSLLDISFRSYAENFNMELLDFLITIYNYQLQIKGEKDILILSNPITTGLKELKISKFVIFKLDLITAGLLNKYLVGFFNDAGLQVNTNMGCDTLIFRDKTCSFKVTDYSKLYISKYENDMDDREPLAANKSLEIRIDSWKVLMCLLEVLSENEKTLISNFVFTIILYNYPWVVLQETEEAWNYVSFIFCNGNYYNLEFKIIYFVIEEIVRIFKQADFIHKDSTLLAPIKLLEGLCSLIKKSDVKASSMKFIKSCFVLFSNVEVSEINTISMIVDIWECLGYILMEIKNCAKEFNYINEFYEILCRRQSAMLDEAINIFKLHNDRDNFIQTKEIIDNLFIKYRWIIFSGNYKYIIKCIKDCVDRKELLVFLSIGVCYFESTICIMCTFLESERSKNYKEDENYYEILAHLSWEYFFWILKLDVAIKNELKESVYDLKNIVKQLLKRNYVDLVFKVMCDDFFMPDLYIKDRIRLRDYMSVLAVIVQCNRLCFAMPDCDIYNIVTDLIQIRLGFCVNYSSLIQSTAYKFYYQTEDVSSIYALYQIPEKPFSRKSTNEPLNFPYNNNINNNYECMLKFYVDFACTVRRYEIGTNAILFLLAQTLDNMRCLNKRLEIQDKSFIKYFAVGDSKIFSSFFRFITNATYKIKNCTMQISRYKINVFDEIVSVMIKLHNIFTQNMKYELSYGIAFTWILSMDRIMSRECLLLMDTMEMTNTLKESYTQYFKSGNNEIKLIYVNTLFYQFLVFIGFNLSTNNHFINLVHPIAAQSDSTELSSDAENFLSSFELLSDSKIDPLTTDFIESNHFQNLLCFIIEDFPKIYTYVFYLCVKKLKYTVDYDDEGFTYSVLCRLAGSNPWFEKVGYRLFIDFNDLITTHRNKSKLGEKLSALCKTMSKYITE